MKICPVCEALGQPMEICRKCKRHKLPASMSPHPNDDLGISAVGERLYVMGEYHPDKKMELCLCKPEKRVKNG